MQLLAQNVIFNTMEGQQDDSVIEQQTAFQTSEPIKTQT